MKKFNWYKLSANAIMAKAAFQVKAVFGGRIGSWCVSWSSKPVLGAGASWVSSILTRLRRKKQSNHLLHPCCRFHAAAVFVYTVYRVYCQSCILFIAYTVRYDCGLSCKRSVMTMVFRVYCQSCILFIRNLPGDVRQEPYMQSRP